MSDVIAFDSEVFYSKKLKYSLRSQIAEQFCRSHLFDCYMVSACDGTTCWAGHPRDFNWAALDGQTLLSHNSYWDSTCYEELVHRNLAPKINYKAWHCTANLSAYICNRRALDQAVEYLFGVKLSKVSREDANNRHWPQDFSPESQKEMIEYARRDAFWCWQIWDKHSHKWPEWERRVSTMIINQGKCGVQIDVALLNDYLIKLHEMKSNTEKTIPWIADSEDDEWAEYNTKPTSTKCIANQCRLSQIPCCPVKSEDEEAYLEWENTYGPTHTWIYSISAWRSVNKLYKTLQTVKERLRDDGTMPFGQKYCGTHTGRVSGESKVNLFNQRKQALLCRQDGFMETDDIKVNEAHKLKSKSGQWPDEIKWAVDFRNLIIPRPNMKMITADLEQVEPRVGAWLAGDKEFLELVNKGYSPYQAHAMTTMGWTGGELKKEDPRKYALAKARLLSLGYGAAFEKLIIMARNVAGIDLTENDPEWIESVHPITGEMTKISGYGHNAKKVVADYRASNPKITETWAKLENALRNSLGSDLVITLPSGRILRYEAVRAETRIEPDKETGKPRRRTVWTVCIGGKRVITYGSKLFENITQAVSRDVHYDGVLNLEDAGLSSLFGVYDEAVLQVPLETKVEDVKRIMEQIPEWLPDCPISVEAQVVERYCK